MFKRLLKYTLLPGVITQPRCPGLLILAYHRIGADIDMELDVPTSTFKQQIEYLISNYEVVSLDEGLAALKSKEPLKQDMVALTFDDGYSDFYENGFPLLLRYNIPATIYLATYYIETGKPFPWDKNLDPEQCVRAEPIGWEQLREITRFGLFTIGCHTHTHPRFDCSSEQEIETELAISKQLIQNRLGIKVHHFCYPEGIFTKNADAIVRKHFTTAVIGGRRKNVIPINSHRLYRIPVQKSDDFRLFRTNLMGGGVFLEYLASAYRAVLH